MAHGVTMAYREMMALTACEQEWLDEQMWTKSPLVEIDSFLCDMIEAKYDVIMKHEASRALFKEDDVKRRVPFISTLNAARNALRQATVLPVVCEDDSFVYHSSIAMNNIELELCKDKPWESRPLTELECFACDMLVAKYDVIMNHKYARAVYRAGLIAQAVRAVTPDHLKFALNDDNTNVRSRGGWCAGWWSVRSDAGAVN